MVKYNLKEFINKYSVVAKKSFGQNFLNNQSVIDTIVNSFDYLKYKSILEIGPGLGALTLSLVGKNLPVVCCESDRDMFNILSDITQNISNLTLVQDDFRNFEFEKYNLEKPLIISNLPYNLTSQLIEYSIKHNPVSMGFMVQLEVANKYLYEVNKREDDALGCFLNMISSVKIVSRVDRSNFTPAPNVDSAFISCENLHDVDLDYLKILKILFKDPNKTLSNNVKRGFGEDKYILFKQKFENFLSLRPRQLTPQDHLELCKFFKSLI